MNKKIIIYSNKIESQASKDQSIKTTHIKKTRSTYTFLNFSFFLINCTFFKTFYITYSFFVIENNEIYLKSLYDHVDLY